MSAGGFAPSVREVKLQMSMMAVRNLLLSAALLSGLAFAAWLPAQSVDASPQLVQKVEAQRRQPLTREQREQFLKTAASMREALVSPEQQFLSTVARLFRLSEAEVRRLAPAAGAGEGGLDSSFVPRIEARLGRRVTPQELHQLRAADNATKAEMSGIQSRYAVELGEIAGLSKERMQRLLPATRL